MSTGLAKINYLNNKDMLLEIHKSKCSYCSFSDPQYHQYDIILFDLNEINDDTINIAMANRTKRVNNEIPTNYLPSGKRAKNLNTPIVVNKSDLIFRIMTYDHIPLSPGRKKNPKTTADLHERVNFPPFQHWKFDSNDQLICVGKSHWVGDLDHGHYDRNRGQMTSTLAKMIIKLCERYSTRGNFRSYTYLDEMQGQAILQLSQIGLQFDEAKSDNPFSYFTSVVSNSFIRIINVEKKNQEIRDDILQMNGLNPSYTRTSNEEHEVAIRRQLEGYE